MRSAIRVATTGRQGAVHLNMPANMLGRPVPMAAARSATRRPSQLIDMDGIARTAELLANARRPCLLAGHGVELAGATDALIEFAHAARVPVMTSPKAARACFRRPDPLVRGRGRRPGGHERAEKYQQVEQRSAMGEARDRIELRRRT